MLEIRNLSAKVNEKQILKNLSLTVNTGEVPEILS